MLALDPVMMNQVYAKPVQARGFASGLVVNPIVNGSANRQQILRDQVDVSAQGQKFSQLLESRNQQDPKQTALAVDPKIASHQASLRSQVLGFLIAQGLPVSQALTQAERIVARLGYGSGQNKNDASNPDWDQASRKPARKTQSTALLTAATGFAVNILV